MTSPETAFPDSSELPSAPQKTSVWEDFVDIFVSPAAVFARRRLSGFWVPLLIYAALMGGLTAVARPAMQPIFDQMSAQQTTKMRQQRPDMTAEQLEQAHAIGEKFTTPVAVGGFTFVFLVIGLLVLGVVIWGVARLFGMELGVQQGMTIATYASIPRFVTLAVTLVLAFLRPIPDGATMSAFTLSPAAFLTGVSPVAAAALARFDLGVLWATALIALGVAVMARRERNSGWPVAAVVWLLGSGWAILSAWRATM